MKLNEYLEEIKTCPNEYIEIEFKNSPKRAHRLVVEYGVDDNYPIFLKADFEKVVSDLQKSGKFRTSKIIDESRMVKEMEEKYGKEKVDSFFCGEMKNIKYIFDYISGTVKLQVCNFMGSGFTTGCGISLNEEKKKHSQRQMKNYNMIMTLHPYQKNKIIGTNHSKAIAIVIQDIAEYIQKERIPACFPNSIGSWRSKDYSKIVYFEPEEDVV